MKFFNGFHLYLNKEKDYRIISIDLGHGDTSAARMGPDGRIYDMQVCDGKNVVRSILGYDENGKPQIGDSIGSIEDVYPYFKERPDMLNECVDDSGRTKREVLMDFLRVLMENIYRYNYPHIKKEDDLILLIGCPADLGWDRQKYEYAEIIRRATRVQKVVIMPESKAAIMNALEVGKEVSISDGVIVFDFGSLTSDCTYILPGAKCVQDFSIPLGASMIEKNMLKAAMIKAGTESREKEVVRDLTHTYIHFRELKELFYSRSFTNRIAVVEREDSGDMITLDVNKELMDRVSGVGMSERKMNFCVQTEEDSWSGHCRSFFWTAKKRLEEKNVFVRNIIITGGASRMPFIVEICRETFPDERIRILHDSNPQFSVSRGLCFSGYKDFQAVMVLDEIEDMILKKVKLELDHLADGITDAIASEVYELVKTEIGRWKQGEEEKSIEQLNFCIKKTLENRITSFALQRIARPEIQAWMESVHDVIVENVNASFEKIYKNRISVEAYRITDEKWKKILEVLTGRDMVESSNVSMDSIVNSINVDGILETLGTLLLLLVIVALASTAAVITAPVRLLINMIFKKNYTWEDVIDWIADLFVFLDKDVSDMLPKEKREKLYKEFLDSDKYKGEIKKKLLPDIAKNLEEQYNSKKGFEIGKTVQDALEEAIAKIALQNI